MSERHDRINQKMGAQGSAPLPRDLYHTYKDGEMLVISQRPAKEELAGNDKAKVLREKERVY